MEILKAKLDAEIGRAEEYRLLGNNHPEGLKVHIEFIKDMIKPLVGSLRRQLTAADENDYNELLVDAKWTLKNLQSELTAAEHGVKYSAIAKIKEKLEHLSGMKLPSFDGSVSKFHKFMILFSNSVRRDSSLTNVEKMILLKSCLTGEPFDLVNALPTSVGNYPLALQLLEDVYGCGQESIRQLYQRLLTLPQVSMYDGVKFRQTYWELESIFQSMRKRGIGLDRLSLRFLYMQKFSEKTLLTVLVRDADMSLSEIRKEIRHLVYVEELQLESNCSADDTKIRLSPNVKPIMSQVGVKDVTKDDVAADKNESFTRAQQNVSCKSSVQNSAETSSKHMSLYTLCANIFYGGKKTSVRLLLQNNAPVSLLSDSTAKRLGINESSLSPMHLKSSVDGVFKFTATQDTFKILLQVGDGVPTPIDVHIIEKNGFNISADDIPGADVGEFKKAHPHLFNLTFLDTGRGRPIDLFLSGNYFFYYLMPKGRFETLPVKEGWRVTKTNFGWLVNGQVMYNRTCSYSYCITD